MADNLTPEQRRKAMTAVKSANTSLERVVDAAFREQGWTYSRNVASLPGKPDFVFERDRVIVFVDGDFWHGWRFPQWQEKLTAYWRQKIERNRRRDRSNFQRLRRQGWKVFRFWSHQIEQNLDQVVEKVAREIQFAKCKKKRKPVRSRDDAGE